MKLKLRIGIAMAALVIALTGCASGAEGGARQTFQTFMQKCLANANTETERSECAWRNAARMSSGN